MHGRFSRLAIVFFSAVLAIGSLAWGCFHAVTDGADLEKRAVEFDLFKRGDDPYQFSRDMTYPPTAPPVFALAIGPFVGRGEATLKLAWLFLNLCALGAVCGLILRLWGRDWPFWLQVTFCLIVVASKPARLGIGLGQFHLIPLALMLGAVAWSRAGRPIRAGFLLGASLVKPTLSLPLLSFFLVRRRWKTLCAAIVFQGVALTITCLWLGAGPARLTKEWLDRAKSQEAAGAIDLPSLSRLAFPDAPISSTAIAIGSLLLGTVYVYLRREADDGVLVSFCCFLAAIFSYHRPYDLVLLLPPFALWVDRAHKAASGRTLVVIAAIVFGALLVAPSNQGMVGPFLERVHDYGFIVLAHYFFWWEVVLGFKRRSA